MLTVTDANGQVTHRQYDGNGNLISQVNALNQETRYESDGENHLTKITDAKGQVTRLSYDAKGRLVSLTNPLGHTQRLEYDAADNLRKLFDAFGQVVKSFNYDAVDKVTAVTDTLKSTSTFDYEALSRLTQTTDPLKRVTQFSYDDLNRLVDSLDALAGHSRQGFDEEGNRTILMDPNGNETHFEFDQSGRLVAETVATGEKVSYTYNARDLLAQVTNARGQSRQFDYDAAGRLLSFTDLDGTVSFSYDKNGNVLTVSDSQGTITRTYDALNRVTRYTDVNGNTLHYEYDEVGNLVVLTYPDGKVVHYNYDAADQLVKVTDWAGRVTRYEYDKNGRLIGETRPNGTQMSRRYNVAGQLVQQVEKDNPGELISQFDFSYDAAGNVVKEQKLPKPESVSLPPVTMTYSVANRLATYNEQAVQFDADGNLLVGPLAGEMANFRFDSRSRLVSAGETSYRYDAENQRIGVNQTSYVINSQPALSQVLVKEENGVKTFYVYGLGLIGEEKDGEYRSYHFDFRGSTVAITDQTGKVVERFQYGPYGELLKGEVSVTPFLFNGKFGVMTDDNGLYYMRARFYSAEMKRFVNMDVLLGKVGEGQTLNRFAFVTGRPVSLVDPFGLEAQPTYPFKDDPSKFPKKSSVEVCEYYDEVAQKQGCNYHSYAAQICRGEFALWSIAANALLMGCGLFSEYSLGQIKNCVRTCLVTSDKYVRENDPTCRIDCIRGVCTKLDCIDSYHHYCFERCGVSGHCYGGNYDGFMPSSWFYDDCPLKEQTGSTGGNSCQ